MLPISGQTVDAVGTTVVHHPPVSRLRMVDILGKAHRRRSRNTSTSPARVHVLATTALAERVLPVTGCTMEAGCRSVKRIRRRWTHQRGRGLLGLLMLLVLMEKHGLLGLMLLLLVVLVLLLLLELLLLEVLLLLLLVLLLKLL
uniref:(northern house mosquito) hypothetical protein n=1 Tax=Culex pipiens TaxID=7175 RepID=A0A8D8GBA2_CULPI